MNTASMHSFVPELCAQRIKKTFISGRFILLASFFSVIVTAADLIPERTCIWTVQGNVYHGSVVGRIKVDGITGASPNTHGGTIGVEYNLNGHFIQALATFGRTKQSVTYDLPDEGIDGEQTIKLYLLDIPVMYNFHFSPKPSSDRDNPRLIFSPGIFASFLLHKEITGNYTGPDPDVAGWAMGMFLRFAYFPYPFKWFQPGLFLEFYRSFIPRFFDDPYFRENGMAGQLGILNSGITIRF